MRKFAPFIPHCDRCERAAKTAAEGGPLYTAADVCAGYATFVACPGDHMQRLYALVGC